MKIVRIAAVLVLCALLAACMVSCRDEQEKVLFKVGSYPVTVEEYTYLYMNWRDSMEAAGQTPTKDEIHEAVLQSLRRKYAVQKMADDRRLALTDEEEAQAEANYQQYVSYYGSEEALEQEMQKNHMTARLFRQLLRSELLEERTRAYVCDPYTGDILADDATVEADIPLHFYRASQVLILHEEGDDLGANRELAESIAARAAAGEDFEALVVEFNEDLSMDAHDGYYFTDGLLLEEFEETAKSLEVGKVSGVIFSELGYHVIKRLPLEDAYIDEHFEDLRELYRNRVFNERADEIAASFEISYYDRFYELEL